LAKEKAQPKKEPLRVLAKIKILANAAATNLALQWERLKAGYISLFKNWYTLMILPQKAGKVYKVRIPQPVFFLMVGFGGMLLLGGAYSLISTLTLSSRLHSYHAMQTEYLRNQVEVRRISTQMDQLTQQLDRMRELDYKLRIVSGLEVERPGSATYGIGGSEGEVDHSLDRMDPGQMNLMTMVDRDLTRLKEMADYQEESFNNLRAFLEDRKDLLERTPHRWPVRGFISSTFGYRLDPFTGLQTKHDGIDIVAPRGTIIKAPADGIVTFAGVDPAMGNMLVLSHGYGIITRYGHNEAFLVREGRRVKRGDPLVTLGCSGKCTGPHLHYEIRVNDLSVNPMNYLID